MSQRIKPHRATAPKRRHLWVENRKIELEVPHALGRASIAYRSYKCRRPGCNEELA